MTSNQIFLVFVTLAALCSWAVATVVNPTATLVEALNVGRTLALPALSGAFAVLRSKATALQTAKVANAQVIAGSQRMSTRGLNRFGDRLLVDDSYVFAVVAVVLILILYEIKIGNAERGRPRATWQGQFRYLATGLIAPNALGAFGLFLIYLRA